MVASDEDSNTISESEYDGWMSAADAKALLASQDDWSPYAAAVTITQRLKDGLIDAVASTLIWKAEGKRESHRFRLIRFGYWPDETEEVHHNFWKSGDISIHVPDANRYAIQSGPTISLYSVRFRSEEIRGIMPPAKDWTTLAEEKAEPKAPIAKSELERFCRLYIEIWGVQATEQNALAACKAMFPQIKLPVILFARFFARYVDL